MLSRTAISFLLERHLITIKPPSAHIGPNSIDLRLGEHLKTYHPTANRIPVTVADGTTIFALDPRNPPPLIDAPKMTLPGSSEECWLLVPGQFYLGVTLEETYCRGVVPHLDGRSTCGRLSIEAHKTAGVGDNGFQGRWTLEIEATEPVIVRPGDRLFQVYFSPCWGEKVAEHIFWTLENDPDKGWEGIFDLHTLYGEGGGHHYQASEDVRGPSPLA